MKQHLRSIEQRLRQLLVEPLQRPGDGPAEPLDVWSGVQKQLQEQITLDITGAPLFPYRQVSIVVAVKDDREKRRLESVLNSSDLRTAVAELLVDEGCRSPANLAVSIEFVTAAADIPAVAVHFDEQSGAAGMPENQTAMLRVVSGQANVTSLKLAARRINIGRGARLKDERGNPIRNNQLAFSEVVNGINETVSRRHAHIEFDEKNRTYRLFRDSASADTSVTSQGDIKGNVPLGGIGLALKSGDIIRVGKAEFEFTESKM